MKLQLYALPDEKLSAMATRLRERIAEKPIFADKENLRLIEKELTHRAQIQTQSQEELAEIIGDDPHRDVRTEEIELRARLQLFDRESPEYGKLYHRWFTVRETGLSLGLWPFFTPEGRKHAKLSHI
jgi:hypothetical protein